MSKGYALHIGLNKLDKHVYPGVPALRAAVNDALFWESFAKELGYESLALHDQNATSQAVLEHLSVYAEQLVPGDILLLTYAGHGSQIPNDKAEGFDDERNDQTWCLYDRELLDDELFDAFRRFADGTRILVVSDSCHSGTMTRALPEEMDMSAMLSAGLERGVASRGLLTRKLPLETEQQLIARFGDAVYRPIQEKYADIPQAENVKAAVKLLAACQDDQTTFDGAGNGVFTESFIDLFKKPAFRNATAEMLIREIRRRYYYPRPNFFQYGAIIPSFDNAFPFTINIPDATAITGYRLPDLSPVSIAATPSGEPAVQRNAQLLIEPAPPGITGGRDIEVLDRRGDSLTIELKQTPSEHAWTAAHALQLELEGRGIRATVEPILSVNPAQERRPSREADIHNPGYIKEWPPTTQDAHAGIGWHLDDDHSQLHKAMETVGALPDAVTAMAAATVATYATALWQTLAIGRRVARDVPRGVRHYRHRGWIAVALPIFLVEGFFNLLTNVDILIVGQLRPPEEVAIYFAAVKTLALVHFVYFAVRAALMPRFSQYYAAGERDRFLALELAPGALDGARGTLKASGRKAGERAAMRVAAA